MNVVWYARKGTLTLCVTPEKLCIRVQDEGEGIADIELAMKKDIPPPPRRSGRWASEQGWDSPTLKRILMNFIFIRSSARVPHWKYVFAGNRSGRIHPS